MPALAPLTALCLLLPPDGGVAWSSAGASWIGGLAALACALGGCAFHFWLRSRTPGNATGTLDQVHAVLEAIEQEAPTSPTGAEISDSSDDRVAAICDIARRLAAHRRYLSAIIESEPECVKTVAADGTLIDMNPAGLMMVGADSIDQVRGLKVELLLTPGWTEAFNEMHEAVVNGESRTLVFEIVGLKGKRRWMETHAVPLRDSEGNTLHLAITRDISNRKRQEAELHEARDRAEAASRTKSEFLANMSHELRTPLTAILGYAELLGAGDSPAEELERGLQAIHGSANHLLLLISDILDISKIEANRLELESLPCDVATVTRDVVDSMRISAQERGISLDVEIDTAVPKQIVTDPMRVRQILVNLVGNAIKFTSVGGVRVEIAVAEDSGAANRLQVRVVDSGIGIDPDVLTRLFTPFTQADTSTTRRFGGTGLGLSITRRLARMLGGDVVATSESGAGSTFTFELVLTPESLVEASKGEAGPSVFLDHPCPPAALPSSGAHAGDSTPRYDGRVLLVEDNPVNRLVLRKMLERLGIEVVEAEDGEEGFRLATGHVGAPDAFDLVLLDMHMPVQDGYTTASRLRDEGFPAPVVALTASAMSNDRTLCLDAGCDDYASKPVQGVTLERIVSRYLPLRAAGDHTST